MATEKTSDPLNTIDRILRERLDQYDVPADTRTEIRKEILAYFGRPEVKKYGATVMTPAASMAADKARKDGVTQSPDGPKPEVL